MSNLSKLLKMLHRHFHPKSLALSYVFHYITLPKLLYILSFLLFLFCHCGLVQWVFSESKHSEASAYVVGTSYACALSRHCNYKSLTFKPRCL
uniref:Uncharacterized protein n=1 Tax=Rhizophora mucronata TaxID=61149 RepID=A0A2P2R111_RHIMU